MYREAAPHPTLRKHIKCFWILEHDYRNARHTHEHLWADAHIELIFTSGQPYFIKRGARRRILPRSFVIGPFENELKLFSRGRTALVAARFWPWGFHSVSRLPMIRLNNTIRSCREVFTGADAFARELDAIPDPNGKIAALERTLLEVIAKSDAELMSRPIAGEILERRGVVRIADLLKNHAIHVRKLQRVFLEEIGISAKRFARIVRFNQAMKAIEKNPEADLLSLAYECGYADQAHFTRNFREMFGMTPTEFKVRMLRAADAFREAKPDVVFLQDEGPENP
jgi:AraC-like DNA-binding protein